MYDQSNLLIDQKKYHPCYLYNNNQFILIINFLFRYTFGIPAPLLSKKMLCLTVYFRLLSEPAYSESKVSQRKERQRGIGLPEEDTAASYRQSETLQHQARRYTALGPIHRSQ